MIARTIGLGHLSIMNIKHKFRFAPSTRRRPHLRPYIGVWDMPVRCDCCGTLRDTLWLDHDHVTGLFRGWVCPSCNSRLAGNGPVLQYHIDYLKRHEIDPHKREYIRSLYK